MRKEAYQYFTDAIPKMVRSISGSGDADSGTTAAASEARLRAIMESYFSLLSRNPQLSVSSAAAETFAFSDAARGQAVQRALQASSIRSAAKDPELMKLVRVSQDSEKQLGAAIATENNLLSQPGEERDDDALKEVQAQIQKLQAARAQADKDIAQNFPDYGNLTQPAPPTPDAIQAALTDDEAFISFYFGRFDGFVWVVRKGVPITFSRIALSAAQLETEVNKLREALEPRAAMISDIPAFDLARASTLYDKLLKPVEAAWKPAKRLVVVTNGALGLLPLSLLPTAPAEINRDDDPLFSRYRKVPWLARTHAVSLMPSASALVTLRQLPPAKPGRAELVAFGDPLFSQDEADEAAKNQPTTQVADAGSVTRGAPLKRRSSPQLDGVASADLAMLPRLPDTADELKSIALALQADPTKALHLGKDANEQVVKSMDLSGVKVLAFATHGLVPGELDGLTQPALALSSPAVAGVTGDGLLTMEEILTLKLDADWVVLSACNTGAGSGAGAEAASGLGHAFFYAGTKALLVTNWSVHSESARELVSDLFKLQAADPKLARSEALRQAMMALVDGAGYVGSDGKTAFAYAHPLFWAPYSIIGDGGASQN
jgi:CHAT domain-containing protein